MSKMSVTPAQPSRWQLLYDGLMLVAIVVDLLVMGLDALLMSAFMQQVADWLSLQGLLSTYQQAVHPALKVAAGFFTVFLVVELLVRWGLAIVQKRYYRWFFFPFVHWYEVLGCAPQLRALRLLRAGVIGYRLHQLGYQVLPASWVKTLRFYYGVVMEEISDRVILTAIDNIRSEIKLTDGHLVHDIIDKHRAEVHAVVMELLHHEITPLLKPTADAPPRFAKPLAHHVSEAMMQALNQTPELQRILRMIPIAGGMIEAQMHSIGQHLAENLTMTLSERLTQPAELEQVYHQIAHGIAQVNTTHPALEALVSSVIDESLTALANQVKIQQWKQSPLAKF